MAKRIRLLVLAPDVAATRGVMQLIGGGTLFFQGDDVSARDICCDNCGCVLATGTPLSVLRRLQNAAWKCPQCGAVNDLAPSQPDKPDRTVQ